MEMFYLILSAERLTLLDIGLPKVRQTDRSGFVVSESNECDWNKGEVCDDRSVWLYVVYLPRRN